MKLKKKIPLLSFLISYISQIRVKTLDSSISPDLVLEYQFGKLVLNSGNANYSHGNLKKCFEKAFSQTSLVNFEIRKAIILGLGLGSVIELLIQKFPKQLEISALEKDSQLIKLYEELYNYDKGQIELIPGDAVDYIRKETLTADLIIVDLFIEQDLPQALINEEVLSKLFSGEFKLLYFNTIVHSDSSEANFTAIINCLNSKGINYKILKPLAQNRIIFIDKTTMP